MANMLFHVTLPETTGPEHFAPFQIALDGMTKINEWHIARSLRSAEKGEGYPIPPLYAAGVVYKEDPPGQENWKDCWAVLADGFGDCDRLVAWRAAELRVAGIACEPVLKWQWIPREVLVQLYGAKAAGKMMGDRRGQPQAPGVWMVHCLVRYLDGSDFVEDPSKILGMGGSFTSKV